MDEFALIRQFFAAAPCAQPGTGVAFGIGDDCAVLDIAAHEQLVVSTDTLVAGVHFPAEPPPALLGERALAVAASDLAAMGATPLAFTLALTLPVASSDWLAAFAGGLNRMAIACGLRLIGGDTTRGPLSLTLTVFGRVPVGKAIYRHGARPGDWLCVGGSLGDAAGALPQVLSAQASHGSDSDYLAGRYWSPQPQLVLGQALRDKATAMLDISDGLLGDCAHIANASKVAIDVHLADLPLSAALRNVCGLAQAREHALAGGDDYRLLFTLPPEHFPDLHASFPEIAHIGHVRSGASVHLLDAQGLLIPREIRGYRHFD